MSTSNSPNIAPSPSSNSGANLAPKPTAPTVTKIVTSREWVLPPRPKPGRKPSADTPATKRKAQNRAAQRAFRERRATRVTELEERLGEVEKEKEINELNFKNIVAKLQAENKFLLKALNDIKTDYSSFKQKVLSQPNNINGSSQTPPAIFSNGKVTTPNSLNYFKVGPKSISSSASPEASLNQNYSFPQSEQHQNQHQHQYSNSQSLSHQQHQPQLQQQQQFGSRKSSISHALSSSYTQARSPQDGRIFSKNTTPSTSKSSISSTNENFDCGICTKDECVCADIGIKPEQSQQQTLLNKLKPMAPVSLKRKTEVAEIDYTSKFIKTNKLKALPKFKKLNQQNNKPSSTTQNANDEEAKEFTVVFDKMTDQNFESPMEQCGFCSDDSPCVCREAAKEAANAITELQNHSRRSIVAQKEQQHQHQHQHQHRHSHSQSQSQVQNQSQATLPPISRHSSVSAVNKLPVLHPGPSLEISELHRSSISTPKDTTSTSNDESSTKPKTSGGCTGNPGTCTQCQMDPMSTLFCTTIASKAEEEEDDVSKTQQSQQPTQTVKEIVKEIVKQEEKQSPVSPPLSNVSSKVSSPLTVTSPEQELNSLIRKSGIQTETTPGGSIQQIGGGSAKGIYIPCADAYKTLSRHKEFNSVDFSTLVGKLTTRGMQVEVQSVANVLRELDRRLYN